MFYHPTNMPQELDTLSVFSFIFLPPSWASAGNCHVAIPKVSNIWSSSISNLWQCSQNFYGIKRLKIYPKVSKSATWQQHTDLWISLQNRSWNHSHMRYINECLENKNCTWPKTVLWCRYINNAYVTGLCELSSRKEHPSVTRWLRWV